MPLSSSHIGLHQLLGSLRTADETPSGVLTQATLAVLPFVTITRQAGTGGIYFGRALADRLNRRQPNHPHPWQWLDRELIERIAADHHISTDLIESLEKSSHSWIEEFLSGLSHTDKSPSEMAVFRRVMQTIRALARAGHVVLVGMASELMTRGVPGNAGLHIHLIAPLEWRIQNLAKNDNLSHDEARKRVQLLDRDRDTLVRRYFPNINNRLEYNHITLNTSMLSEEKMADCILPLIPLSPIH
jgi:cytidylate kinase